MYSNTPVQRGWYALSKNTLLAFILLLSIFQNGWSQSPDLPARTSPILCGGDVTFTTQRQVDNYFNSCPNSKRPTGWTYNGSITLNGPNITNLQALGNLRTINGNLSIINTSIEVLGGVLQSSARLTGNFNAINNKRLGEVNLAAIVEFNDNGSIIISNNSRISRITLPADCEKIAQLRIRNNANLREVRNNGRNLIDLFTLVIEQNPNLQRFPSRHIRKIRGSLSINQTGIRTLDLTFLSQLKGNLSIVGNPALTSISGLVNVKELGDNLTIIDNPVLPNLGGLKYIERIRGNLSIINNRALTQINLDKLQFVGGNVNITKQSLIRDVNALTNLTTVIGRLSITNNRDLSSITGLKYITTLNRDRKSSGLVFLNNPRLTDCCTANQLVAISTVTGNAVIGQNGFGCSSIEEIRFACAPVVTTCELLETIRLDPCDDSYSEIAVYSYRGATYLVTFPSELIADAPIRVVECQSGELFCSIGGFRPLPVPGPFNDCSNFLVEGTKVATVLNREEDCPTVTTCELLETIDLDPCDESYSEIAVYSYRGAAYLVTFPTELIADIPIRVVDCNTGEVFCSIGVFGPFPPPPSNCPNFLVEGTKVTTVLNREEDCPLLTTCDLAKKIDLCDPKVLQYATYSFRGRLYLVTVPRDNPNIVGTSVRDCETGEIFCFISVSITADPAEPLCPNFVVSDATFVEDLRSTVDCPVCPCTKELRPVCGSDGITYDNACLAECAGVSWTEGGCGTGVITCGEITVFTDPVKGSITIKGKPGEHYFFKVHRTFPKWERVFNCVAGCGSEVTIPNLASGTYYIDVYDKSWKLICRHIEVELFDLGIGGLDDKRSASSRSSVLNTSQPTAKPIVIYPNPAQQEVTIKLNNNFPDAHLYISNHLGQLVKTIPYAQFGTEPISLSEYSNGVYQISVVVAGRIVAKEKLVIMR